MLGQNTTPSTTVPQLPITPTAAIVAWLRDQGWAPVPLSAPVLGDPRSGKNPVGGADWPSKAAAGLYQDHHFAAGSNVGVACGTALRDGGFLLVMDLDGAEGVANWQSLCARNMYVPNTFTVQSGSGVGLHLYFRTPRAMGGTKIAPKIDTRGRGGQVVSPGCVHFTGGVYTPLSGDPRALESAPSWLLGMLFDHAQTTRTGHWDGPPVTVTREMCLASGDADLIALAMGHIVPHGERHNFEVRVTMRCVQAFSSGVTYESVRELLRGVSPEPERDQDIRNALRTAGTKLGVSWDDWQQLERAKIVAPSDPLKVTLTLDDCKHQAKKLGRSAGPKADAARLWRKLALEGDPLEASEIPDACKLIARAYPHVPAEAVKMLVPDRVCGLDVISTHLAAARAGVRKGTGWNLGECKYGDEGKLRSTPGNVYEILRLNFWACLRENKLGLADECCDLPWRMTGGQWVGLRDSDFAACALWFQTTFDMAVEPRGCGVMMSAVCETNPHDPLREMLEMLPAWDGIDRAGAVLYALRAEPTELHLDIIRKWLISAVARALRPGCKVDTKLVLIGDQGQGKSTFFEILAGPGLHVTAHGVASDKDQKSIKHRHWIVEDAEMSSHSKKDVAAEKADLSTSVDVWRKAYGRSDRTNPRSYVEVGTWNPSADMGLLRDETGARRYWLLETHGRCDWALVAVERAQIWAEAVARFRAGEPWWFETVPEAMRATHEAYRSRDTFEQWLDVVRDTNYPAEGGMLVVANPHSPVKTGTCARLDGQVRPSGVLLWITAEQYAALLEGITGQLVSVAHAGRLLRAGGLQSEQVWGRGPERGQRRWWFSR